jgi:hypothetical protein
VGLGIERRLVGKTEGTEEGDAEGREEGEAEGTEEGDTLGAKDGLIVGCLVGKNVVEQTPLQEGQAQGQISTVAQLPQQDIQLHLLERKGVVPTVVTEFGKVTALVKPEQLRNA